MNLTQGDTRYRQPDLNENNLAVTTIVYLHKSL